MKKTLQITLGQFSSAGRKAVNQDFHGACMPDEPQRSTKGIVVAIADGISSSDVSQLASETAIKGFLHDYYSTSPSWSVKTAAYRVLKATNSWLYSQTRNSPYRFHKDKGYVCTFSAVIFKSTTAHIFHCGDARILRLSDGALERLTTDHRRVVDAHTSYLTRALGIHDTLELEYSRWPLNPGDVFILATDGVYEYLEPKAIIRALHPDEDLDVAAQRLVQEAYDRGSDDNLTLQIARIDALPPCQADEVQQQVQQLPPPPKLEPGSDFDGYRILRELYISSRSHVFLAETLETRQVVVIKTPAQETRHDQRYLESFLMEDWIAKRINNPHVLKGIASNTPRHYLYSVSEYIEGQTLRQWILDNPTPDLETVRTLVTQIARGLQAFHRQEMVHRDLRPDNILLDTRGTAKIIDFGATQVAGLVEAHQPSEGIAGTAQFTAPELFLGESATAQADIFSLGVITYQMLSGKLPYGNAIAKTRTRRAQSRLIYQSLQEIRTGIPGWVDHAIHKATHPDPAKRYTEVAEFVYELKNPSPQYLRLTKRPLMERDPVLFWQCVSLALLGIILIQHND